MVKVLYTYVMAIITAHIGDAAHFKKRGCCDAPKDKIPCNMDNPLPNKLCQSGKKEGAVYLNMQ